ncbi:ABC-type glycerol-3-phosphate transport system permease component [Lysobacter niastensis]|uniref:ABC-type glycerol-3-phosphate transport system permease component n=1 Tax=Lysobacter niastensis TaxID=380629 RepID=A0ABU1W5K9_9GAMM|nr:hypothetical protein [Lysobacter niastensis]MDR7132846.1 ABC-type glycerol-3-phosphate transport system permease component [Lysobacter niastensis]
MSTLLATLFLLAFIAIVPLYAMYFSVLLDFGRDFQRLHPDLYERLIGADPPSFFSSSRTYKLFRAVQSGKDVGEPLQPALLASYRSTRKYLLAALSCFMVLLFSGLADSFMSSGA